MMTEPKPLASLSSGLLARKGQAKPAMRPQGFAGFGMTNVAAFDDLGWNDMGSDPIQQTAEIVSIHAAVETSVAQPSLVHRQQAELARDLIALRAPNHIPRAAPGSKGKAAFTLRLDPERHLQLRLICAVQHRSAQQIVIAALDTFLATQPESANLAVAKFSQTR